MSGAGITIDIGELAIIADRLNEAMAKIGNLTPVLDDVGAYIEESTRERFEGGRGPDGAPWQKTWRGGQTLVDSGRLRDSITRKVSSDQVEVGTNVIYAAIHQFGGTIKAKTAKGLIFPIPTKRGANRKEYRRVQSVDIPARPYLGISSADEAEIANIINEHIASVLQ